MLWGTGFASVEVDDASRIEGDVGIACHIDHLFELAKKPRALWPAPSLVANRPLE